MRQSGIPRADIFVTSKFWPQFAAPERVGVCLDRVLAGIGIEDVDLWVPRGGGGGQLIMGWFGGWSFLFRWGVCGFGGVGVGGLGCRVGFRRGVFLRAGRLMWLSNG